ncbi:MOB kinase activator 1B-like [Hypanus sabinus]|uniref:MOB kinase activator 1B-like n=2 Tax=Myliobatiformes TaxID=117851 RepID=UPI0028C44FE2|nr:MOB kinase activator 1B-like [Hypanus sabinus]
MLQAGPATRESKSSDSGRGGQAAAAERGAISRVSGLSTAGRRGTRCNSAGCIPPITAGCEGGQAGSMSFLFGNRSSRTFKPKKNIPEGSHQYKLLKHAEATLGSGNLRLAVMLPDGEDLNEWIAVNTVDFFNQINMLYGTITDFCSEESCPVMSAGPKYEYHWADGTNVKKPIKCSAPKYIDYLMTWVQEQLDDETLFPSKIGVPFPRNFISVAKAILKRLFRVYAHIYHQHFESVIQLQEEAHLNTSFKHFIFFVQEFNLIDRRELAPLQELIEKLTTKDR